MKKLLVKILFKLLGFKTTSPVLIDGSDFVIKFNNKFYIMEGYTLEQQETGKENLHIKFTDILSVLEDKNKKKRWDY